MAVAPTAVLTASETSINLPNDTVLLDSNESTANMRGSLVKTLVCTAHPTGEIETHFDGCNCSQTDTGVPDIVNNNDGTWNATHHIIGDYAYKLTVKNNASLQDTDTVTIHVLNTTGLCEFGASGDMGGTGSANDLTALTTLGGSLGRLKWSRYRLILTDYVANNPAPLAEAMMDAGVNVVINLNNDLVQTVGGNKVPNPFVTNLTSYATRITPIAEYFAGRSNVIFAIENEPTNKNFNSGTMAQYLALLTKATQILHEHDCKVMDGAVHVELVNTASETDEGRSKDVYDLITGYANIPLDYVNIHTSAQNNQYPAHAIKQCVDKLKLITGKQFIFSNEWHIKPTCTPTFFPTMVNQFVEAGVVASIYITGSLNTEISLFTSSPSGLTPYGTAYKNAIIAAST